MQKIDNIDYGFSLLFPKNKKVADKFTRTLSRFQEELRQAAKAGVEIDVNVEVSSLESVETFEIEVYLKNVDKRMYYVSQAYDSNISVEEKAGIVSGSIADMINAFNLLWIFSQEKELKTQ